MFALRSARLAGLSVPKKALKGCRVYLDLAAADPSQGHLFLPAREAGHARDDGRGPPLPAIPRLAARFPALVKGVGQVVAHLKQSGERNIYYWYYATQLLHNMQNKDWPRWNVKVRDGLVDMQVTGTGCDRGSWDPLHPIPDRWARTGGGST